MDHWKSGQSYPQKVYLPADMPPGRTTIRWLWVCKYTDELFVSCFDTEITGGGGPSPTPVPTPTPTPTPMPSPTPDPDNGSADEFVQLYNEVPSEWKMKTMKMLRLLVTRRR